MVSTMSTVSRLSSGGEGIENVEGVEGIVGIDSHLPLSTLCDLFLSSSSPVFLMGPHRSLPLPCLIALISCPANIARWVIVSQSRMKHTGGSS